MDEILLPINEYNGRQISLKYHFITSPIPRSLYLLDTLSNIKANPYRGKPFNGMELNQFWIF